MSHDSCFTRCKPFRWWFCSSSLPLPCFYILLLEILLIWNFFCDMKILVSCLLTLTVYAAVNSDPYHCTTCQVNMICVPCIPAVVPVLPAIGGLESILPNHAIHNMPLIVPNQHHGISSGPSTNPHDVNGRQVILSSPSQSCTDYLCKILLFLRERENQKHERENQKYQRNVGRLMVDRTRIQAFQPPTPIVPYRKKEVLTRVKCKYSYECERVERRRYQN